MWHEDKKTIVTMVQVNLFNETIIRPVKDILSSQDREEVIEKDWITILFENLDTWNKYEDFRERVLRFAPKQVKITNSDIVQRVFKNLEDEWQDRFLVIWALTNFLREKDIYSSEYNQWETSE